MEHENDPTAPRDLSEARLLITTLRDQLKKTERENELLRHKLDVLCRRLFGKKSEKVNPNQLRLALELVESETGSETDPVEADSGEGPQRQRRRSRRKRPTGRQELPEELPGDSSPGAAAEPRRFALPR